MKRLILLCLTAAVLLSGCALFGLPKGALLKTSLSPSGAYRVNAYLVNGGATTSFAVRCEAQETATGKVRNIYWQNRENDAVITWKSDTVVVINGVRLDVITDSYDYRRDVIYETEDQETTAGQTLQSANKSKIQSIVLTT